MSRHSLTQIDLEARTAVCSVCGPTQIHVTRPRTTNPPRVYCGQQYREYLLHGQAQYRRRFPAGQPEHSLSAIDAGNCTAVCAICGPTDVYRGMSKGKTSYRCATYTRAFSRRNKSTHLVNPYAKVHILSEIDAEKRTAICAKCGPVRIEGNPGLISLAGDSGVLPGSAAPRLKNTRAQENSRAVYEYIRCRACRRCGSMAIVGPQGFGFFEMHLPKEQWIARLVHKAEPDALAAELEKRDLYCRKCLHLVKKAFADNTPVPEFRPFPTLF